MIFKRIFRFIIFTETIVFLIIVVINPLPLPIAMTFDTEMIVGHTGQFATTGSRFEQPLCQCNTGRYAVLLLMFYR